MKLEAPFRAATVGDCYKIAQLFRIASDGVDDYVWNTLAPQYPGLTPIEIGAKRYASDQTDFSYKNCIVAEREGKAIGIMATFPTAEATENDVSTDSAPEETSDQSDVLAPYSLKAPGTWHICAIALFPEFRNQGLGTQFLSIARQQAHEQGCPELSLLCFEQNTKAMRFYERNGFKAVDRAPVVPHELIHYTGDVLLMTALISARSQQ